MSGARDEKNVDWVLVLTVWNSAEAVMIVSRLRDQGIAAIIGSEATSQSIPVTAGVMSEIEVLVPGPMEDRALRVLKDLGFLAEEDETDKEEE